MSRELLFPWEYLPGNELELMGTTGAAAPGGLCRVWKGLDGGEKKKKKNQGMVFPMFFGECLGLFLSAPHWWPTKIPFFASIGSGLCFSSLRRFLPSAMGRGWICSLGIQAGMQSEADSKVRRCHRGRKINSAPTAPHRT